MTSLLLCYVVIIVFFISVVLNNKYTYIFAKLNKIINFAKKYIYNINNIHL